ncbi:MAG TPA: hypothetical protein VGS19_38415 [Streptosporangiaceae bacterium]|nr:hypothetical protein [Streptosporangiaceae bacterium]
MWSPSSGRTPGASEASEINSVKLRVLCLHGYHGSTEVLRAQMKPLLDGTKSSSAAEFVYVDAPSLTQGDYGWWHRGFRGWERTRDWAIGLFGQQSFDGVFGFSQGAALTALLAGMRAPDGRTTAQQPLAFRFAIMVSGFRSDSPAHAGLFAARESFALPSVHIMSRRDPVVSPASSRLLAAEFDSPIVLEHSGGHVIPGTPEIRDAVAGFLADMAQGGS